MTKSALYAGDLVHVRNEVHARRRFRYPVYMAALDVDQLDALRLRLFSHNRRNVFALFDDDYTLAPHAEPFVVPPPRGTSDFGRATLRTRVEACLRAYDLPAPHAIRLVTNLRVLGYVFNPVSFALAYDASGALVAAIAEVNNTYGGRHVYVLGPRDRIADDRRVGFRVPRTLFVSPFLHGPAAYEFWFDAPLDGARLAITMHVDALASPTSSEGSRPVDASSPSSRIFVAHLTGARQPFTDATLARVALRYPLMALQVIGLIHYEALKLRLLGAPYRRPADDHRALDGPPAILARPALRSRMNRPRSVVARTRGPSAA